MEKDVKEKEVKTKENKSNTSKKKVKANNSKSKKSKENKSKVNKNNNKTKIIVILSLLTFIIIGCSFSAYYLYSNGIIFNNKSLDDKKNDDNKKEDDNNSDNKDDEIDYSSFDYDSPLVASLIDNSKYNLTSSSVFYQYNKEEIKNYYINIDFNDSISSIKDNLFILLQKNQIKLNYSGNNSSFDSNYSWANYCLVDRNYLTSPLTEEEVILNKWNKSVYMDILYQHDDYLFPSDGNNNSKLDREHILPKSYGFNGPNDEYKKLFAGTDLHNLRSSDHIGNSTSHSDRFYNDVRSSGDTYKTIISNDGVSKTYYYDSLDSLGNKIGYFEPCDEDKGDIARSIFYMVSRYYKYIENDSIDKESPALTLKESPKAKTSSTMSPNDTKETPAEFGVLSVLKKWNEIDPVDEFEKTRNNLVFNIQGNRNPFIDYPGLVNLLF